MRDIKFRAIANASLTELDAAGIPYRGKFVYGSYSDGFILGPVIDVQDEYITHQWWVEIDKSTLEQYTGLKDINGKLIYEGDILKVTADDGDFYLAPVKYGIDQDYPAFDLDGKYVSNHWGYESNRLSSIAYGDGSTMSIVGNIHENKDLLEGGK